MLYTVFFFNDTATTEIYTLSLHDALPICAQHRRRGPHGARRRAGVGAAGAGRHGARRRRHADRGDEGRARHPDRKSTRLNSSHANISYAVFCLKKKKLRPWRMLKTSYYWS